MRKFITKSAITGGALALVALSGSALAISPVVRHPGAQADTAGAKDRLTQAKLNVCQRHEMVINGIMNRIALRGQKHLDVFSAIATKVEAFYSQKGLSVANYDDLLAAVNSKKTAAQAVVDKVKTDKAEFKCDGTNPKGVAEGFKNDLKQEIQVLHAYQQSIKDLVVAVKSAKPSPSNDAGSSNNPTTDSTAGNNLTNTGGQ